MDICRSGWHRMSDEIRRMLAETDDQGGRRANERLFAALYGELRRLADRELHRYPGAGVSPTTLVHETYINLIGRGGVAFADRTKCLGYLARAMRGLLIDFARRQQAMKRGAGFHITELNTQIGEKHDDGESMIRLSEALDELAQHDPQLAEVVDLKYFCGFSFADIAKLRGISERTVQRDWQKVRLLLHRHISAA
jgi:RNA polymerase sigma factor (TIGR02999 family)